MKTLYFEARELELGVVEQNLGTRSAVLVHVVVLGGFQAVNLEL